MIIRTYNKANESASSFVKAKVDKNYVFNKSGRSK